MTQYCTGAQRSDETWNFHGRAVRIAIQLGLHSSSAAAGLTALEFEVRKRTWWQCFILDCSLSMTFGRPPAIAGGHIKLALPLNVTLRSLPGPGGIESPLAGGSEHCKGAETFLATMYAISTISMNNLRLTDDSSLYKLCEHILADMYGQNMNDNCDLAPDHLIECVVKYEQKLSNWQYELPHDLQSRPWKHDSGEAPVLWGNDQLSKRFSTILRLRFLNARLLLHRPILYVFLKGFMRSVSYKSSFLARCANQSIAACNTIATEIITIVHELSRQPSLLGAWWFSAYYSELSIYA